MSNSDYAGKHAYRGAVAANYDRDRRDEAIWEQEQAFVAEWATSIPPNGSVLDIPAGTGRFAEIFLQGGRRVIACDISPDMLAEVRARFDAAKFPRLEFLQADAERLPLPNGAVTHLVSWRFFHLLPLPVIKRVLREFRRVASDTVVVQVFSVRTSESRGWLGRMIHATLSPIWRRIRRPRGSAERCPWQHITSYSHLEAELLAAFAASDLRVRSVHTFSVDAAGVANRVYFLQPAPSEKRSAASV